jgi:DNA (cytosine-5)-methyltransferase 1
MPGPRLISLFSGAGGLDYGFEAAGFETAVAVEMDHQCCETLRTNRRWPVIERDISQVRTEEALEVGGCRRGQVEVLIGGPPCQPFSKAGYWARGDSRRLLDPRSNTLREYLRFVEEALPRVFLLENVPGLSFTGKDEGLVFLLEAVRRINRRTRSVYRPYVRQLNAADYGVPQLRQRVFVVACRDGSEFKFPAPSHSPRSPSGCDIDARLTYRTSWDALADVRPEPGESLKLTGKWADLLPTIPEGENYLFHTDRGGGLPLFGWRRRYWTFLLKLAKDRPSWTIQAQPGPATGPFHWENRYLSARELCRLQTFPDDVRITGSRREVQRQVGNAVPSLLAEVLARAVKEQLLGMTTRDSPKLLPLDRSPALPPSRPLPVPRRFRALAGDHTAHPGTGKGYRAAAF